MEQYRWDVPNSLLKKRVLVSLGSKFDFCREDEKVNVAVLTAERTRNDTPGHAPALSLYTSRPATSLN